MSKLKNTSIMEDGSEFNHIKHFNQIIIRIIGIQKFLYKPF